MQHQAQLDIARLRIEQSRAQTEATRVAIEAHKAGSIIDKTKADTLLSIAKAQAEEANVALNTYQKVIDSFSKNEQSGVTNGTGNTESI
jgi:hypothetical protein